MPPSRTVGGVQSVSSQEEGEEGHRGFGKQRSKQTRQSRGRRRPLGSSGGAVDGASLPGAGRVGKRTNRRRAHGDRVAGPRGRFNSRLEKSGRVESCVLLRRWWSRVANGRSPELERGCGMSDVVSNNADGAWHGGVGQQWTVVRGGLVTEELWRHVMRTCATLGKAQVWESWTMHCSGRSRSLNLGEPGKLNKYAMLGPCWSQAGARNKPQAASLTHTCGFGKKLSLLARLPAPSGALEITFP